MCLGYVNVDPNLTEDQWCFALEYLFLRLKKLSVESWNNFTLKLSNTVKENNKKS